MVKCILLCTHVGKTQEFNYKINVIQVNLEKNMRINISIHPHYG
jgi:hypothetical protein